MEIIRTGSLFSIESLFPSASETIEGDSGAGCRNMSGDSMHNWGNQSFVLALTRIAEEIGGIGALLNGRRNLDSPEKWDLYNPKLVYTRLFTRLFLFLEQPPKREIIIATPLIRQSFFPRLFLK